MVCRLVENKQVHLGKHQLGKGKPRPFTAGQYADLLLHILAAEHKCGKSTVKLLPCDVRVSVPQLVKHSFFRRQVLVFLVVVTYMHIVSEFKKTSGRFQLSKQYFKQSRFAGAIGACDKNMFPFLHLKAYV